MTGGVVKIITYILNPRNVAYRITVGTRSRDGNTETYKFSS